MRRHTPTDTTLPQGFIELSCAEWCTQLPRYAARASLLALDIETTGLKIEPLKDGTEPRIISAAVTLEVDGQLLNLAVLYPDDAALNATVDACETVPVTVAHNSGFERMWVEAFTDRELRITDDTLEEAAISQAVLKHPQDKRRSGGEDVADAAVRSLKPLVIWGYSDDYGIDTTGAQIAMAEQAPVDLLTYNAKDTFYTARLHHDLTAAMTPAQRRVYENSTRPMLPILHKLNTGPGFHIDRSLAAKNLASIQEEKEQVEKEIRGYLPGGLNLSSSQQLATALFEDLGLTPQVFTAKGAPSTSKAALAKLDHPVLDLLGQRSKLERLSQFLAKYLELPEGRGVPSSYRFGTATGRLTSSGENIQQIPRDDRVRGAFCAAPGKTLVVADFSQVELRLAAMVSGDAALTSAYREGVGADLHVTTAESVLGEDLASLPKGEQKATRSRAKAVNFGFVYGMGAEAFRDYAKAGFGRELTATEAEGIRNAFFEAYPGLLRWHAAARKALYRSEHPVATAPMPDGSADSRRSTVSRHVETLVGRRRSFLPAATSAGEMGRAATNHTVQGLAADVLYQALIRIDQRLATFTGARLVATVHDSVIYEVAADQAEELGHMVRECMEAPDLMAPLGIRELPVPLVADVELGTHWDKTMEELAR